MEMPSMTIVAKAGQALGRAIRELAGKAIGFLVYPDGLRKVRLVSRFDDTERMSGAKREDEVGAGFRTKQETLVCRLPL